MDVDLGGAAAVRIGHHLPLERLPWRWLRRRRRRQLVLVLNLLSLLLADVGALASLNMAPHLREARVERFRRRLLLVVVVVVLLTLPLLLRLLPLRDRQWQQRMTARGMLFKQCERFFRFSL